jgi:hypothetical protein
MKPPARYRSARDVMREHDIPERAPSADYENETASTHCPTCFAMTSNGLGGPYPCKCVEVSHE